MTAKRQKKRFAPSGVTEGTPTPQRYKHAQGAFEIGGDKRSGKGNRIVRMLDSPLEQVWTNNQITDAQYENMRRLRLHWFLGDLAGSPQSMNYNRVGTNDWINLGTSERQLQHKQEFIRAFDVLTTIEKQIVSAVVLIEIPLSVAGVELGYRSPYRARQAALEILRGAADRLARVWAP
jgi:hypothetical protein